ncbi:hypothetical protein O3G_MSEX000570 [Manduca sexta]|nr:hypothetical protein O3G_MSEX000570 [Manduca sexta]
MLYSKIVNRKSFSYRVELKSIKVVNGNPELPSIQDEKLEYLTKTDEPHFKTVADFMNINYPAIAMKDNDPLGYLNKANSKVSHLKHSKDISDYDVYYKKDLTDPKKWSNDKVRIYLDKDKRRIRNSFNRKIKQNN